MAFADVKFIVYVSRSQEGSWPATAFVSQVRQLAAEEAVTGALLDDGVGLFHIVEGTEQAVDRFMAFVLMSPRLSHTRVVYETQRSSRMFGGRPLAYCFDDSWRHRTASLIAGHSLPRKDLWQFCKGLAERIGKIPPMPRHPESD